MAARKPGKVGWGIMSTALIGTRVVIPAMMSRRHPHRTKPTFVVFPGKIPIAIYRHAF